MTDALGNSVVVGKNYGYSQNSNGFTYIITGEVVKVEEKYVSIKRETFKRSLYGGVLEDCPEMLNFKKKESNITTIRTPILFPI